MPTSLDNLPAEIILNIAESLRCEQSTREHCRFLGCLGRANRRLRSLLNTTLWKLGKAYALEHGAATNNLDTLRAVPRYTGEDPAVLYSEPLANQTTMLGGARLPADVSSDGDGSHDADLKLTVHLLHLAAGHGHLETAKFLLEHGAAGIDQSSRGFCPCVHLIDQEFISTGMEGHEASARAPEWLPLHHALCGRNASLAIFLLESGAPLHVTGPNSPWLPAVHIAAANGEVEVVRYLINRWKANPDEPSPLVADEDGYTAMHYLAAFCHDFERAKAVIQELKSIGLDADGDTVADNEGGPAVDISSPLCIALSLGSFSAARALMEAEASLILYSGRQRVHGLPYAVSASYAHWARFRQEENVWKMERERVVRDLILLGPLVIESAEPRTSLMRAAMNDFSADMIRLILDFSGVDIDQCDMMADDKTALMFAAQSHDPVTLGALLDAGAEVNFTNHAQFTALDYAELNTNDVSESSTQTAPSQERKLEVVRLLLENGANIGLLDLGKLHGVRDWNSEPGVRPFSKSVLYRDMDQYLRDPERDVPLQYVLENSTRANLSEESWQRAVESLFPMTMRSTCPLERKVALCKLLADFGKRHGYLIDDHLTNGLEKAILQNIESNNQEFIDLFFALGDEYGVSTHSGVFTREAMLVVALLASDPSLRKQPLTETIWKLLEDPKCGLVGRIPQYFGATLLHLACDILPAPEPVIKLLSSDGPSWDPNTVTVLGQTPLMLLIDRQHLVPEIHEAAKVFLSLGADPCRKPDRDPDVLRAQRDTTNLLRPRNGERISRCALGLINRYKSAMDVHNRHDARTAYRNRLMPNSDSVLEVAIKRDRVTFIQEFAKYQPFTAQQSDHITRLGFHFNTLFSEFRVKDCLADYTMLHALLQLGWLPDIAATRHRQHVLPTAFTRMLSRASNLKRFTMTDLSEHQVSNLQFLVLAQLGRDLACLTAFVRAGADVNLSASAADFPDSSDDKNDQDNGPWWTDPRNYMSFVQVLERFQTDAEEDDQKLVKAAVRNAFAVEEDTAGLKTIRCRLPESPELDEWLIGEFPSCANPIMNWVMGWLDQVPEEGRKVAEWLWRPWRLVDGNVRMIARMPRIGKSARARRPS